MKSLTEFNRTLQNSIKITVKRNIVKINLFLCDFDNE